MSVLKLEYRQTKKTGDEHTYRKIDKIGIKITRAERYVVRKNAQLQPLQRLQYF
jgi:hypothetical protein